MSFVSGWFTGSATHRTLLCKTAQKRTVFDCLSYKCRTSSCKRPGVAQAYKYSISIFLRVCGGLNEIVFKANLFGLEERSCTRTRSCIINAVKAVLQKVIPAKSTVVRGKGVLRRRRGR